MLWRKTDREQTKIPAVKKVRKNPQTVPIEGKAVAHGLKDDSEEKDVKIVVEKSIIATGMKDVECTIDCPAISITHAFVEF